MLVVYPQSFHLSHSHRLWRHWHIAASSATRIRYEDLCCFSPLGKLAGRATYTVSQKNDTDAALYNFKSHQPILVIFGRNAAE